MFHTFLKKIFEFLAKFKNQKQILKNYLKFFLNFILVFNTQNQKPNGLQRGMMWSNCIQQTIEFSTENLAAF